MSPCRRAEVLSLSLSLAEAWETTPLLLLGNVQVENEGIEYICLNQSLVSSEHCMQ